MKRREKRKGFYIGFTGIDGAGKSTQAALLNKWLKTRGLHTLIYEERRNFVAEIADLIAKRHGIDFGRKYFGEGLYLISISFEVLRQHLLNIQPYQAMGVTIVTPRTAFDWLAGGMARGCNPRELEIAKEIALFRGGPDLLIWLDTSPRTAYERILKRGFDKADLDYLRRYQEAFTNLLYRYPHIRIEGDNEIEVIQTKVQYVVGKFLEENYKGGSC